VALAIGALGVIVDLAVLRGSFVDLRDDTWEYLVAARHLLAGDGFRTSVIHPPLLAWLRPADSTVPVLIHGPLVPLLLVPLVALAGDSAPGAIGWLSAPLALLAAAALFRLARPRFGDRVAGVAAALLPWTPLAWRALNHDAVLLLGALLFTLSLEAALRARPRPGWAGLWCGLCYLARAEALLLAPIVGIAAALEARRAGRPAGRAAALFAAGFAGCALPWWWHNALSTGSPFFNLSGYLAVSYWPPYHNLGALLDPTLDPTRWREELPALIGALPAKMWSFLPHAAKLTLLQPSVLAAPLTIGGMVWLWRAGRGMALATLGVLATLTLLMCATVYDVRYLATALPLICLASAAGAVRLVHRLGRWGVAAAAALLALAVAPASWREATGPDQEARGRAAQEQAALDRSLESGEPMLVLSDIPDLVAWRTGWPVVWVDPEAAPEAARNTAARAERWVGSQSRLGGVTFWLPDSSGRRGTQGPRPATPPRRRGPPSHS
jgi:hypothetical protein